MSFGTLLKKTRVEGNGIDLFMKLPTLGARKVKDKSRKAEIPGLNNCFN